MAEEGPRYVLDNHVQLVLGPSRLGVDDCIVARSEIVERRSNIEVTSGRHDSGKHDPLSSEATGDVFRLHNANPGGIDRMQLGQNDVRVDRSEVSRTIEGRTQQDSPAVAPLRQ